MEEMIRERIKTQIQNISNYQKKKVKNKKENKQKSIKENMAVM